MEFKDFDSYHVIKKFLKTLTFSLDIDDCDPNHCENGGTCQDRINAYLCSCAPGYTGNNCEKGNGFRNTRNCT